MRAVLEDRLAGLVGTRQGRGVDVDYHLVSLCRSAGIDAVVEGRLREQRQRIGLLLGHRRRISVRLLAASLLIQGLAGGGQRCTRSAPTSGVSRPRSVTVPSSS